MKLRYKTFLKVGGLLFLLNLALFGVAAVTMRTKFHRIERDNLITDLERTMTALDQKINFLGRIADDYAKRDDSYSFLQNRNQDYLDSNHTHESLLNLQVSLVLITDLEGKVIFSRAVNLARSQPKPVPVLPFSIDRELEGIVLVEGRPIVLVSSSITRTDRSGEKRGFITFGKFLDNFQAKKMKDITQTQVSIETYNKDTNLSDINSSIEILSPTQIVASSVLNDIFGDPALVLRVHSPRPIMTQLNRGLSLLAIYLTVVGGILSIVIITFIEKVILSRLSQIHTKMKDYRSHLDTGINFTLPGDDEISTLGSGLNQLMEYFLQIQSHILSQSQVVEIQNQWLSFVAAGHPLQEVLELMTLLIEVQIPNSFCLIMSYNADENTLHSCVGSSLPPEYLKAIEGTPVREDVGSCGASICLKKMVITEDIDKDPLWKDYKHSALKFGLHSCWSYPICSPDGKKVYGTFAIYHSEPAVPSSNNVNLLQIAAFAAGIAMEREERNKKIKLKFEKDRTLTRELQQALKTQEITQSYLSRVLRELTYHLSNTPLAIIRWNQDFQIENWSKKAEEIFGWSADEVMGKRFNEWNFIFEDDTEKALEFYTTLMAGENLSCSIRNYRKDGAVIYCEFYNSVLVDKEGKIISILSIVQDVTDRKRCEIIIQAQKTELDRFFSVALDLLCIASIDGDFIRLNPKWQNVLGFPIGDMEGTNLLSYVHSDDHNKAKEMLYQLAHNNQVSNFVIRFRSNNNSHRCLEWSAVSIGRSVYAAARDITDRYEIDRMKDEFISIVSHEIRTPLTAIRGALGMLGSGAYNKKPEQFSKMIAIAQKNSERLQNLITNILDMERLESGKYSLEFVICSLANIVRESIETVAPLARASHININNSVQDLEVFASPSSIQQVLVNLLGNAIKFSPNNTEITIRSVLTEDLVVVEVSDRGRGIPEDKFRSIFDRFEQVDLSDSRDKNGSGLGLAICKKIIEQHNTEIWVESKIGEGSTFYFTLPLVITRMSARILNVGRDVKLGLGQNFLTPSL